MQIATHAYATFAECAWARSEPSTPPGWESGFEMAERPKEGRRAAPVGRLAGERYIVDTNRQTYRQTKTDRWTDGRTGRQTDRRTDRQANRRHREAGFANTCVYICYKVPLRELPGGMAQERNPSIQHLTSCGQIRCTWRRFALSSSWWRTIKKL